MSAKNQGDVQNWQNLKPFEKLIADDNRGNNAPVITAVFRFNGVVTSAWAVRNLAQRFATHPRFRSCVDKNTNQFVEVDNFDASLHVERYEQSLTSDLFDELLSTPLAKNRPPWKIHVFAPHNAEVSHVVLRVHHVVGDGVGLVEFALQSLTDGTIPGTKQRLPPKTGLHPVLRNCGAEPTITDKISRPFRDVYGVTLNLFFPDPRHCLNTGVLSPKKRAAWAKTRSVHTLRSAARHLGVTLNDLMLGALTGAVRLYTKEYDKRIPKNMNAALPVNRHSEDSVDFVHNALTVVIMNMPIKFEERKKRLAECRRIMRDVKDGSRVPLSFFMFRLLAALPQFIQFPLWRYITKRVTLLFTNVPGPKHFVKCGDKQVMDIRCLAPAQASTAMVVSAFSYADIMNAGIWVDANHVQFPAKFLEFYDLELDALLEWTERLVDASKQAMAGGSQRL